MTLFYWLVGQRYGYLTALALAQVTSVSCAFWLYRHLVFRVRGHVWRDLARFETVYLSAFAVNLLVLPVLVQIVHYLCCSRSSGSFSSPR